MAQKATRKCPPADQGRTADGPFFPEFAPLIIEAHAANVAIRPHSVGVRHAVGEFRRLPCLDAGDPSFVPLSGKTHIDGEPHLMGRRVGIWADEATVGRPSRT